MKELYTDLEVEVVVFENADIITTSGTGNPTGKSPVDNNMDAGNSTDIGFGW